MKKNKISAFLLALCAFLIAGCGGINGNIKLASTNLSASSFYAKCMDEMNYMDSLATKQLQQDEGSLDYEILQSLALSGEYLGYNLISALDFCIEISETEGQVGIEQKIFEYETEYSAENSAISKIIVHVGKAQGKSNVFNAKLYVVDLDVDYSEIVEGQMTTTLENSFTISRNRALETYEFTDSANLVNGSFLFSPDEGRMSIDMTYNLTLFGEQNFDAKYDFYNYTNNVVGVRMLTETNMDNEKVQLIFECLSKSFNKNAKIGVVKDAKAYLDLASVEEGKIGVPNKGDDVGYEIKYINNSDANNANITVNQYGLRN